MPLTFLELSDLPDKPRAKTDLPFLRIGDRLNLGFRLERMNNGRREVLDVSGEYSVTSLSLDLSNTLQQVAQVSATGKAPSWQAVKLLPPRTLPPAKFPPTEIK